MKIVWSKKLCVMVVTSILMVVNAQFDNILSEEVVMCIAALVGAYLVSQGFADHGAQGAAKAAERALKQGVDVSTAIQNVLGAKTIVSKPIVHDDDENPGWHDTSEMDERDKPGDLLG